MAIIVKLSGGHSNQMFQYAAGRSLAARHGVKLMLDITWFPEHARMSPEDAPRVYELGSYNLQADIYKRSIPQRAFNRLHPLQFYVEKDFKYDREFNKLGAYTHLEGHFQFYKYFEDVKEQIREEFTLTKPATGKNKKILDTITNDPNAVSLHIRRGDYATNHYDTHGLVPLSYYREALKLIQQTVPEPNVYVITNDPKWCREYLKLPAKLHIIANNDDVTGGAEDMRLMRACKHNIMANSSFSWWGAWLNPNSSKIVIAPKKWFKDPSLSTKGLLPKEWIQL
jgi:hypothetical protein